MLARRIVVVIAGLAAVSIFPATPASAACATSWSDIGAPAQQFARDVVTFDTNTAWAVGGGFDPNDGWVARYNGSSWDSETIPEPGNNTFPRSVDGTSDSDVWIVGSYEDPVGSDKLAYIVHWNGSGFTRFPLDTSGMSEIDLRSVDVLSSTDAWAVGSQFVPGSGTASLIVHWDGTSWSVFATPVPKADRELSGVDAITPRDAWAVGSQGKTRQPLAMHWNGRGWRAVALPPAGGDFTELFAVSGNRPRDVWAVGVIESNVPLTMHFDGTTWSVVSAPAPSPEFNVLHGVASVNASQAWAVGNRGNAERPLLLRWNGSDWRSVRIGSEIRALQAIDEAPDGSMMIVAFGEATTNFGNTSVLQRCPAA